MVQGYYVKIGKNSRRRIINDNAGENTAADRDLHPQGISKSQPFGDARKYSIRYTEVLQTEGLFFLLRRSSVFFTFVDLLMSAQV
jgi:hypothetical protein